MADVNVLAKAGVEWIAANGVWPEVPPDFRPINAAAVSIFADADQWELWISPAIRLLVREVLLGRIGEEFRDAPLPEPDVDAYLAELDRVVAASGGESVRPRMRVTAFIGDNEDDRNVASLAASILADVVISWDREVHEMGIRDLPIEGGGAKEVRFLTCGDFVQHVHNVRTDEGGW